MSDSPHRPAASVPGPRSRSPWDGDPLSVWRILDANANRLLEGLRTWEEFSRFVLQSTTVTERIKGLRQAVGQAIAKLPIERRMAARNVRGDVGTELEGPHERHRRDARSVALAALARCQESLRCLEEYTKVVAPSLSTAFESARYELYEIQVAAEDPARRRERLSEATICLLATCRQIEDQLLPSVGQWASLGPLIVQLRDKEAPVRDQLDIARRTVEAFRETPLLLIVNDRPDLAALSDADGVHVGLDDLSPQDARRIIGPARLLGVSTHNDQQIAQAVEAGADYLGFGPVAPSATKSFSSFVGIATAGQAAKGSPIPVFAIGGIGSQEAAALAQVGVRHAAVSSSVWQSSSPIDTLRALAAVLRSRTESPHANEESLPL